jgi:hypothetical protein
VTVASFYDDVRTALKRGTSQDGNFVRWTRKAVRKHEDNIDFAHMLRYGEVTAEAGAESPELVDLPNDRVKEVILLQPFVEGADGTRAYGVAIERSERQRMNGLVAGSPWEWWWLGDKVVLGNRPQADQDFEILWREYTAWPTTIGSTDNPAILSKYETLLFAEVMVNAWTEIKDFEALAVWKSQRDEALAIMSATEENRRWQGQRLAMGQGRTRVAGRDGRLIGAQRVEFIPPIVEDTDFVSAFEEASE